MTKELTRKFVVLTTLVYAMVISILSSFHEVWRDEVVFLSLVKKCQSLGELFQSLHHYGHPPLFHTLLYLSHAVIPHPIVLKVLNIFICVVAIYLFLLRAPFTWKQKLLFIGGILPLYTYPIINRNYGLSMLLIFVIATLYKYRFKYFIPFCLVLFLLANVHAHSMIIVISIICSLMFELVFLGGDEEGKRPAFLTLIMGLGIVLSAIYIYVAHIMPDQSSIIFKPSSLSVLSVIQAIPKALFYPGSVFSIIFGFISGPFVTLIIWSMYIYLLRNMRLFVIFFLSVMALNMFFILIFPSGQIRHQASLYLLIVLMLWLDQDGKDGSNIKNAPLKGVIDFIAQYKDIAFNFIMIIHICMGLAMIKADVKGPYSSSKNFAQFIKSKPEFKDAIITAVSGSQLEALPYYLDNKLYFFTEDGFADLRTYSNQYKNQRSLTELLEKAKTLQKEYDVPIIILLHRHIRFGPPYIVEHSYTRSLKYTDISLKNFLNQTKKIADFDGSMIEEDYGVYLLN